jgi:hypothetical protein
MFGPSLVDGARPVDAVHTPPNRVKSFIGG